MKYLKISEIKPDPNQPRRTFNVEKMEALEASMKADGFRKDYPIIVDDDNTIIDGERRWRAAKAVGIKEVPVETKSDIKPYQRLLYQLQSEGAELDVIDRNTAWAKLWTEAKGFETKREISKRLGKTEDAFSKVLNDYDRYQKTLGLLGPKTSTVEVAFDTLVELSDTDKTIAEKAITERWTRDKTVDIKRAIEEFPHRKKEILSQNYASPINKVTGQPDNSSWKSKLEVAKMDIDLDELEKDSKVLEKQQTVFDAYYVILNSANQLKTALDKFDYKVVAPEVRVRIHKGLSRIFPSGLEWFRDFEDYMIENGELDKGDVRKLKG